MAEETKVTLVHKDEEREFSVKHAESLLKYQQQKGFTDWQLPEKSGFKYENGTINPTSAGASQKPGK